MGDKVPPVSNAEAVRIGELGERIARLKQLLDASPPRKVDDLLLWYQFLAVIKNNVTPTDRMTLYRGGREIRIRYLGRGHTAGNVVVFLPREKVVMTGDFLTAGLSNMSESFPDEWVKSLDNLKALDFDTVLPGHGDAFTDKSKIGYFEDYMRDV